MRPHFLDILAVSKAAQNGQIGTRDFFSDRPLPNFVRRKNRPNSRENLGTERSVLKFSRGQGAFENSEPDFQVPFCSHVSLQDMGNTLLKIGFFSERLTGQNIGKNFNFFGFLPRQKTPKAATRLPPLLEAIFRTIAVGNSP